MTKVYIEADGNRRILSAKGHATGSVECCAAISGILYALAGYLSNVEFQERIEWHSRHIKDGDVYFDVYVGEKADVAFEVAACGLLQIQKTYPQFIQVEIRESD